jgi:large subunit ribosomal protein L29
MTVSKLQDMSMDELQSKDRELAQELFNLRFQLHTGRLENTAKVASVKKEIARVKTILREKRG